GDGLLDALKAVKLAQGYAEGSFAENEFPSYLVGNDSVPDNGQTDLLIAVSDPALPLAVTLTIDGQPVCTLSWGALCLQYGWDPDLDADLYESDSVGTLGTKVFSSGCPGYGDCGAVGQRETLYVAAPSTTHYVVRVFGWDGDPNNGKGGTFTYEVSNGPGAGGGTVNDAPVASFTASCTDLSCVFTDTSSDSDGTVVAWSWDFGDGSTSTAQNPSHSYASGGTYTVTLTVTDDGGASDSTSQGVTVSQPAPAVPTEVSIDSITYSTKGGKDGDKHLFIDLILKDDLGDPVGGATVAINLLLNGSLYGSASGSTDENGRVGFSRKNADPGCYTTNVTNVTADGLAWDGGTPANNYCK
ncbi:MAG: PKD domain-containing protein, partial [Woeseia sp.]